jgi:dephospho-CoA kinase
MKIIGFVGLPGSGKGEASKIARHHGLAVVVMGDIIREEAARQGLEPTDRNLGRIGNALRARDGPDAIARRILDRVMATGKDVVVVDGLRSKAEADFFRAQAEEFHLVEVYAPAEARLKWLATRGRPDDPGSSPRSDSNTDIISSPQDCRAAALKERESREMGWGMYEAIDAADMSLRNDRSLDDFRKNVEMVLGLFGTDVASSDDPKT